MLLNGGQVLTERAKISGPMEAWVDIDTGERWTFHDGNLRTNQLAHVLLAGAFTWIYSKGVRAADWLGQGLRFGVAVVLLTIVSQRRP